MGGVVKGLAILAAVSFFAFTEPGQELLIKGVDVVSSEGANWLIDSFNENEERAEARGPRSERKCGDELPPVEARVSEEQAIEAALKFWDKNKVPCDEIETELQTDGKARWVVTLPEKRGCRLTVTIDAATGKAIEGSGGCP